jgi:hypothetical protein
MGSACRCPGEPTASTRFQLYSDVMGCDHMLAPFFVRAIFCVCLPRALISVDNSFHEERKARGTENDFYSNKARFILDSVL